MLKNYFKTAFRNIFKHKTYSVINITGLAIGITAFFLIINYVSYEFSYDSFNKNYNNIYRVNTIQYSEDNSKSLMAVSASAVGPAMKYEFREVTDYTRLFKMIRTVVSYKEKAFRDFDIFYADSSFLKIFTYPLLSGDAGTALSKPNTVVITKEAAKKYFGEANPIGKILKFSNRYDIINCMVTGILKDIPENSHIKFDMLVSINTPSDRLIGYNVKNINSNWNYDLYYNYVLLKPGTDYKMLNKKLQPFYIKHKPGSKDLIVLKPLKDIYLSQPAMFDFITGNKKIIYLLLTFALMIIIIAWINYVNLSTAKSMERAKEVGIRKAVGSSRPALIRQFLFESVLVNIISVIISLVFIELSKPFFCNIVGKNFTISAFSSEQLLIIIALFIAGILASGWYPAVVLSSFNPSSVLKGNGRIINSGNGNIIRKSLIVFQFSSSIILIIVTWMVYKQIVFMQNKSLGMNIDKLLVIKSP
ncbi:MAG: ABC transporter permease, partial [Ignavibacteriaceae bacterium]